MKLHTYLNFAGDTEEAFKFYGKALGGKLEPIVRFKDMPIEGAPEGWKQSLDTLQRLCEAEVPF